MSKRSQVLEIPARDGRPSLRIPLPKGIAVETRHSVKTGRLSATLTGFMCSLVIRERERGWLQYRASWLPEVVKGHQGDRLRAGTQDWAKAVAFGIEAMETFYTVRRRSGTVDRKAPVTLHKAIRAIRRQGLIPGGTKKVIKGYRLVLDLAEAILPDDPFPLHQGHVVRFFAARTNKTGFTWPSAASRRRALKCVSKRTVKKNLTDLNTALRVLLQRGGPGDGPLLRQEPFEQSVDFGDFKAEVRESYTVNRLQLVLGYAEKAEDLLRNEGLVQVENRSDGRREARKRLNVVPGMLHMGLHHQFTHPTRPVSWQAVKVSDIAFEPDSVVALIHSMRLTEGDTAFSPEVADRWVHGAIVYRREDSKLGSERIVPLSKEFAKHLKRFLDARAAYLAETGVGSDALYPSPRDPTRSISDSDTRLLLKKGDEVARRNLASRGENPDRWVPLHHGTEWYGYRRLWKTVINQIGWERTAASMYAGDWKPNQRTIADDVYARITPGMLLAVVERIPFTDAVAREQARPDHVDIRNLEPIQLPDRPGR
jgi:hypothetical protein